ncbi:MAG: HEPN domain-containing protein [Candidatus Rokuibacteriota bacterium]
MSAVAELERIAEARLADARVRFAGGRYDGAAYLCGYAVEVALKARICRTLDWPEFPSTTSEFQAYRSFQTHELDVLLRLSGQEAKVREQYFALWNSVAVWKTESRYNVVGTAQQVDTQTMVQAAERLLSVL